MEREYWISRWKESRTGFNLDAPHVSLVGYFHELGLKANPRVFVPLCGKTIDMKWLSDQGCSVIGVEFSHQACEDFFVENKLNYHREKVGPFDVFIGETVTLFCGDFFNLTKELLGRLDAIYDRAALIALPSDIRVRYAQKMATLTSEHTKILLITTEYDQSSMQGPPFSVDESEVSQLFGDHFAITKKKEEPFERIADHLREKGLNSAQELVFLMTPKAQD